MGELELILLRTKSWRNEYWYSRSKLQIIYHNYNWNLVF